MSQATSSQRVTIYHNPRCSKSRQTLALLQERGIEPEIVEYLNTPPSRKELEDVLQALGIKAHELLRTKEAAYEESGLTKDSTEEEVISAMLQYPVLMERPIVVCNGKAALGRPPEQVLDIL